MCFTKIVHNNVQDNLGQDLTELKFGKNYDDICDYIEYDGLQKVKSTLNDLSVIFVNIRGILSKQVRLSNFLKHCLGQKKVDVIILAETWLTKLNCDQINIPGYKFTGKHRPNRNGGGVGFLISEDLRFKVRDDLLHDSNVMENCIIEVETKQNNILMNAIYRPPNTNPTCFNREFDTHLKLLNLQKNKDIVIGLDHNLDFLKSDQHPGTLEFIENTLANGLIPIITRPTRVTKSSATLIDNILVSQKLSNSYTSGVICHDLSDHFPCLTILEKINCKKNEPLIIKSRKLNEKNIANINQKLGEVNWTSVLKNTDVNIKFESFHQVLLDTIDSIAPEKEMIIPAKRVLKEPWMTNGLLKCCEKLRKLYLEFMKCRNVDSETKYKSYRKVLQTLKRHSKKLYYHDKCTEYKSNMKNLWKLINNVCSKNNDKSTAIDCLKIDNILHYTGNKITNEFGEYFSNVGKNCAEKLQPSKRNIKDYLKMIPENAKSIFWTPCDREEISKIISSLPNKTSSGFDNISNVLLKKLQPSILDALEIIFNESIQKGVFPSLMKHAEIVPLFKGGQPHSSNNYRPISLLLTISKLLEKLIYCRTYKFLNGNGIIYNSQYGFRTNHSCEHAITELVGEIVKNQSLNKHTIAIFLDLSKAFDTLQHSVLFSKLSKYGIRGNALAWFKSYLTDRSIKVKCSIASTGQVEKSNDYPVDYGTPQGSCLGPLLFLIFCNDLHLQLSLCNSILFADDTTIYKSHSNLRYLKWCVEEDLKAVSDWLRANKLTLNVNKTVCLMFPKNQKPIEISITLDDQPIKKVTETKFLGVWIDTKLNWTSHLNKLYVKLNQSIGLIRKGKNFLDTHSLRILYFAQFQSHLNYGLSIWGNMISSTSLNKLQRLQNTCVNLLGKNQTIPDIYTKLKIMRVEQLIKLENCKFAYKMYNKLLPIKVIKLATQDQSGKSLEKKHCYNTRQKNLLNAPKCSGKNYLASVLCKSIIEYRTLSLETRQTNNFKSFVIKCKKTILT